jgi:hypothetical protein
MTAPLRNPTVEEMRIVAQYLSQVLGLHSAAGKLLANAAQLERAAARERPS